MEDITRRTIAVIGLGLIGGSVGYALRRLNHDKVIGFDIRPDIVEQALRADAIGVATASMEEAVSQADITIFCTAPGQILRDLPRAQPFFKEGSVVSDICGVKKEIVSWAESCLRSDVNYIGIHPMAGKEVGGFANADPDLFRGAGFILIVPEGFCPEAFRVVKDLVVSLGAGRIEVNPASVHDRIIGYTSDLMHVAATALCKTFPTDMTMAHTAGAFRDCTRVAAIDAGLWTDLLMRNRENVLFFLEAYVDNLRKLGKALADGDNEGVHCFLAEAAQNKSVFGGK
ncbi:MAG: prephenate dehydrogenase/arogenate dehydrogenase family protein [Peptococcaceae bacterium]|nr:prephenate dehydrogenase/arogenate dehydrogenase family protein [Peptococcaceae bacterium]